MDIEEVMQKVGRIEFGSGRFSLTVRFFPKHSYSGLQKRWAVIRGSVVKQHTFRTYEEAYQFTLGFLAKQVEKEGGA